jgi:hypothetical protein
LHCLSVSWLVAERWLAGARNTPARELSRCLSPLAESSEQTNESQWQDAMPLNAAAAAGKPPSARSGHSCTALPAHLSARLSPSGSEDGAEEAEPAHLEGLLVFGYVKTKPDLAGPSRADLAATAAGAWGGLGRDWC